MTPISATTQSIVNAPANGVSEPTRDARVLKAAREFESIFLRSLLHSLEKTTQVGSGGPLGAGQSAYGSMIVGAMADTMSSAGGIGLSEVVARALSQAQTAKEGP